MDAVRAPVLILAGENDPRCPIRQIENYVAELERRGVPHEVYRFDAGHGSLVDDEVIRQVRAELDFAGVTSPTRFPATEDVRYPPEPLRHGVGGLWVITPAARGEVTNGR